MPAPRHTEAEAAQALVAVAPLAARWIETLLAGRLASLIGDLPRPEIDALARALPQVEAALSGAAPPRRPPPPRPPHPPHRRGPRP